VRKRRLIGGNSKEKKLKNKEIIEF